MKMLKKRIQTELARPIKENNSGQQQLLFSIDKEWKRHWWGMPEFSMQDQTAKHSIVVNFICDKDLDDFCKLVGRDIFIHGNVAWYPPQCRLAPGVWKYTGEKANSRYPICIPSKGRANTQTVSKNLDMLGVSYLFFVEDCEYKKYCDAIGVDRVIRMPFSNLGQGSIPARNFIWDWAKENGYPRHWVIDDNIQRFMRINMNRRHRVHGGAFFQAMEDFVDRYENIALAGPHEQGFIAGVRTPNLSPITWNSRIYSCILIDTSLPHRWRGRYNEDTDLSLRVLKDGHCTLLFNALLMDKPSTSIGDRERTGGMRGGNTDTVYTDSDHRLAFAKSLQAQHPDVVKVVWKFQRWHHQVDYSPFKDNKPILRKGIVPTGDVNDYGMVLTKQTGGTKNALKA